MPSDTSATIGIVGLGNMGHLHANRLVNGEPTLVGGMDIAPAARERFAEAYGVATTGDADGVFDAADAVVIATPNRYHEPYAVAALEAGLDVLIEKPLAHTLDSAERIAAAARDAAGFCSIGFRNRFLSPTAALGELRREGRFGDITHAEITYVRRRGVPGEGGWFTDRELAGGGSLIDIGVHAIDLSLWTLGFPGVAEVVGTTRCPFDTRSDTPAGGRRDASDANERVVDDSASAFLRCTDGTTVSLETAWATNRFPERTFVVRGTEAGARVDLDARCLKLHEGATSETQCLVNPDRASEADSIAAEQRAFVRAVERGDAPPRNTVEEGLAVQRVVEAIYRSSREERAVRPDRSDDAEESAG